MNPGYIIGPLVLVSFIAIPFLKLWSWKARWDAGRYGAFDNTRGVLVRFETGTFTPSVAVELDLSLREIMQCLKLAYPGRPDLLDFRVEVRRVEDMASVFNVKQGGTTAIERALPVSPKVHVAIVQDVQCSYYIAHEVARHIVPLRIEGNPDRAHALNVYAMLEQQMKDRIKARLTAG